MNNYDYEADHVEDNQSQFEDKWKNCKDCGKEFCLAAGDQEFISQLKDENGKPIPYHEPKRCMDCRLKRREQNKSRV